MRSIFSNCLVNDILSIVTNCSLCKLCRSPVQFQPITLISTMLNFPNDVLSLHGAEFYELIKQSCGDIVVEALKVQEISSVDSLLRIENIFSFFDYESQYLRSIKEKIGIYLNDGSFIVKPGILIKVNTLLKALQNLDESHTLTTTTNPNIILSGVTLEKFPFLQQIIQFLQNSDDAYKSELIFLYEFIENTFSNLTQSKSRYRYNDHIKRFGLTLFLLGGRNLYQFIYLNLPGALPHVSSLQKTIDESSQGLPEGNFRYEMTKQYLVSMQSEYVFCAEDCTAVVPKVVYNSRLNTFIGFSLPLFNGFPLVKFYSTDSFQQLENWFTTTTQSTLLNIQTVQPLGSHTNDLSPYLLSAYGTDGRYTSNHIISRWIEIFENFRARSIRVLGYSTDCDSKYLRSMRIITRFFTSSANTIPHLDNYAFNINLNADWIWFYLKPQQLFICFQDPIHIATKLRNRLLSSTATMLLGNESMNINYLVQMIDRFSKLEHGLVKSDVIPKDRQNYSSCTRISSDSVIETLKKMQNTSAIRIYLQVSQGIGSSKKFFWSDNSSRFFSDK